MSRYIDVDELKKKLEELGSMPPIVLIPVEVLPSADVVPECCAKMDEEKVTE